MTKVNTWHQHENSSSSTRSLPFRVLQLVGSFQFLSVFLHMNLRTSLSLLDRKVSELNIAQFVILSLYDGWSNEYQCDVARVKSLWWSIKRERGGVLIYMSSTGEWVGQTEVTRRLTSIINSDRIISKPFWWRPSITEQRGFRLDWRPMIGCKRAASINNLLSYEGRWSQYHTVRGRRNDTWSPFTAVRLLTRSGKIIREFLRLNWQEVAMFQP